MNKYLPFALALATGIVSGLASLPYGWSHVASYSLGASLAAFMGYLGITNPNFKNRVK